MSTTYTPPPAKPLAPSFSLPYVVAIVPYLQNAEAAYHKQWGSPVLAQYKTPQEREIHLSGLRAAEVLSTQLINANSGRGMLIRFYVILYRSGAVESHGELSRFYAVTLPWVWPGQGVPLRPVY